MQIVECEVPCASQLDRALLLRAAFRHAFRAPLRGRARGGVALFHAIFLHRPWWMRLLFILRNGAAALAGLDVPSVSEVLSPAARDDYRVGDRIGGWPIHALGPTEIVAGRDNKHLDFRVSVLDESADDAHHVCVSTVCVVHNAFGAAYLSVVVPFHRWGLRRLIRNAMIAGRL